MALHHKRQDDQHGLAVTTPALVELKTVTAELDRKAQRQRELVAQVRSEGGSWAAVSEATGVSQHAARKRWRVVPVGSMSDLGQATQHMEMGKGLGSGGASIG